MAEISNDDNNQDPSVSRDKLLAAARPFVESGVQDPDDLYDSPDEAAQALLSLHDDWQRAETERIKELPLADKIRATIAMDTVWLDAGFNGIELLSRVSADWLMELLATVDQARSRSLSNEVKAKIREIVSKIKELDPGYEVWDPDDPEFTDWNPSVTASPADFYPDFAYYFGPSHSSVEETIEAAVKEYLRIHRDADSAMVAEEMRKAAAEYSED